MVFFTRGPAPTETVAARVPKLTGLFSDVQTMLERPPVFTSIVKVPDASSEARKVKEPRYDVRVASTEPDIRTPPRRPPN